MLRICRKCGTRYEGDPGSTLCPSCVRAGKQTTIQDRTCRECGVTFPGGPRAWYCPDCRAARRKDHNRDYNRRKAAGKIRPIGSEDICIACGKLYTVASGKQRYCPACAPDAHAAADRQQALAYYAAHRDPDSRRELRKAHAAELICAICGKPYVPTDKSKTCSPACAAEYHRRNAAQWEQDHRDSRNQQQRERYARKKEEVK